MLCGNMSKASCIRLTSCTSLGSKAVSTHCGLGKNGCLGVLVGRTWAVYGRRFLCTVELGHKRSRHLELCAPARGNNCNINNINTNIASIKILLYCEEIIQAVHVCVSHGFVEGQIRQSSRPIGASEAYVGVGLVSVGWFLVLG